MSYLIRPHLALNSIIEKRKDHGCTSLHIGISSNWLDFFGYVSMSRIRMFFNFNHPNVDWTQRLNNHIYHHPCISMSLAGSMEHFFSTLGPTTSLGVEIPSRGLICPLKRWVYSGTEVLISVVETLLPTDEKQIYRFDITCWESNRIITIKHADEKPHHIIFLFSPYLFRFSTVPSYIVFTNFFFSYLIRKQP